MAARSIALSGVQDPAFKSAEQKCQQVAQKSTELKGEAETAKANLAKIDEIRQHLIGNVENRIVWLEMLRAVNECLPHEPKDEAAKAAADGDAAAETEKPRKPIMEREELHITSFECQRLPSADAWIAAVKKSGWYQKSEEELAQEAAQRAAMGGGMGAPGMGAAMGGGMGGGMDGGMGAPGMGAAMGGGMDGGMGGAMGGGMGEMGMDAGAGAVQKDVWIIQLEGYHYHNGEQADTNQGAQYVRNTLVRNLQEREIYLPTGNKKDNEEGKQKMELVTMKELGISYPVLINPGGIYEVQEIDRDADTDEVAAIGARPAGRGGMEMEGGIVGPGVGAARMGGTQNAKMIKLRRFDFKVQFCWHPTPPTVRHEKKKKQEEAKAETGQFGNEMPNVNP